MKALIMILGMSLINCRTIQLGQKMIDQAARKHNERQKMDHTSPQYLNMLPVLANKFNNMDLHKMMIIKNPK